MQERVRHKVSQAAWSQLADKQGRLQLNKYMWALSSFRYIRKSKTISV